MSKVDIETTLQRIRIANESMVRTYALKNELKFGLDVILHQNGLYWKNHGDLYRGSI